jgi:hypothetical protein
MEAPTNLRSVLLSELPPKEKEKFFKFLLENEVQFTEDDHGYFVALIRLVNPTSPPDHSRLLQDTVSSKQKRASTPTPAERTPPKARPRTPQPTTPTLDSTRFGEGLTELFSDEAVLNTVSSSQRATGGEVLDFRRVLPADKPRPTALQVFLDNCQFPALVEALKINSAVPLRPKTLSLGQLVKSVEELYSAKYKQDMQEVPDQTFAEFVAEFLVGKYRTLHQVQQQGLDLMQSLETHEPQSPEARMCAGFLQGTFSGEDLVFFLFLRATVQKELKVQFVPSNSYTEFPGQKHQDARHLSLNLKQCSKVTAALLGSTETLLQQRLLVEVERELSFASREEGLINLARFMELLLQEYHASQIPALPNIEPISTPYEKLKEQCVSYAEQSLAPQFLSIILSGYRQLTPSQLQVLKAKALEFLVSRMKALIEAAFGGNKLKWLELLGVGTGQREALSHVEQLQKKIREASRQSTSEDVDSICKWVLQTTELRTEMGKLLSKLSQG